MTRVNLSVCDLCRKVFEIEGQIHGAELMVDVFQKNFKLYRENFHMCLKCFQDTGMEDIVRKLHKVKRENEHAHKNLKKIGYLQDVPLLIGRGEGP